MHLEWVSIFRTYILLREETTKENMLNLFLCFYFCNFFLTHKSSSRCITTQPCSFLFRVLMNDMFSFWLLLEYALLQKYEYHLRLFLCKKYNEEFLLFLNVEDRKLHIEYNDFILWIKRSLKYAFLLESYDIFKTAILIHFTIFQKTQDENVSRLQNNHKVKPTVVWCIKSAYPLLTKWCMRHILYFLIKGVCKVVGTGWNVVIIFMRRKIRLMINKNWNIPFKINLILCIESA